MYFRTSLGTFRLALLAAMGATVGTACSGTVRDGDSQREAPDAGPGGASSGGASTGGAAAGGWSSGGAGGASAGGTSGGPSTGGVPAACSNPTPLSALGKGGGPSGGFVRCDDGTVHRPSVGECWSGLEPLDASVAIPVGPDGYVKIDCKTNADCVAAPHGHCSTDWSLGFGGAPQVTCHYGCVRDSECAAGQICLCGDPVGTCVPSSCRADTDCADGLPCLEGNVPSGCGTSPVFACGPLCRTDADCAQAGIGYTTCQGGNCRSSVVCGRPFLVHGAARLASAERRDDWAFPLSPDVATLPADVRRALTEHYTAIGSMEHASVAAFARFSLELLSLGAPSELVSLATDAMRDETRHARVCFGLASVYGGAPVGPGPLPLDGVLAACSVEEQIRTAFLEACVGETLAAIEVAEAAERATDPVVVGILRRITEDEARHAALGFQFVKWALERLDPRRRTALETELLAMATAFGSSGEASEPVAPHEELLARHGLLPSRVRHSLRDAAMREAVLPCVHALLSRGSRRALAA